MGQTRVVCVRLWDHLIFNMNKSVLMCACCIDILWDSHVVIIRTIVNDGVRRLWAVCDDNALETICRATFGPVKRQVMNDSSGKAWRNNYMYSVGPRMARQCMHTTHILCIINYGLCLTTRMIRRAKPDESCNVGPRLARQYVCIYGSRWILWTTRARQLFQRTTFQYTFLILLCYQMIRIRIGLF